MILCTFETKKWNARTILKSANQFFDRKFEVCIRLGITFDFVALEVVGFINEDSDGLGGFCVVVALLGVTVRFDVLPDLIFELINLFGVF